MMHFTFYFWKFNVPVHCEFHYILIHKTTDLVWKGNIKLIRIEKVIDILSMWRKID